jgi:hypothetical protein
VHALATNWIQQHSKRLAYAKEIDKPESDILLTLLVTKNHLW